MLFSKSVFAPNSSLGINTCLILFLDQDQVRVLFSKSVFTSNSSLGINTCLILFLDQDQVRVLLSKSVFAPNSSLRINTCLILFLDQDQARVPLSNQFSRLDQVRVQIFFQIRFACNYFESGTCISCNSIILHLHIRVLMILKSI